MPDESRRNGVIRTVVRPKRWRFRSNRQIWLITLALVIVACGAAIGIPSIRPELLAVIFGLACAGWIASQNRSSRLAREEAKDHADRL